MGEIADDLIDGVFCQQCGEYIDDEESEQCGPGHPRNCTGCN